MKIVDSPFDLEKVLVDYGYSTHEISEVKTSDVLLISEKREELASVKEAIKSQLKVTSIAEKRAAEKRSFYFQVEVLSSIVIPVLVFLSCQAFDVGKGILADWIYDLILKAKESSQKLSTQKVRHKKSDVRLDWIIIDNERNVKKAITYEGPAEPLPEILKGLSTDRM